MTVPLATVVELGSVQEAFRWSPARRVVMAGQSPVAVESTGIGTAGRPDDSTTNTVLPSFSFFPGFGTWLRICPTGAVIEVLWPVTDTWNLSWCTLASAWVIVRPVRAGNL